MHLYPLKFEPIYKPKVWGGRRLQHLGRTLPGDASTSIGESWELSDLPPAALDADGPSESVVANGPLAGRTLRQLLAAFPTEVVGQHRLTTAGRFPLLIKYLDAREHLSVQTHPTAAYQRRHPHVAPKHEAWYVLDAMPGSKIFKGLHPGVTANDVRAALRSGDAERLLQAVPARVGDCHFLASGVCHALGAGVMVAEIQTPADTTFRLYDWGRGRTLHIEQALECMRFDDTDDVDTAAGPLIEIERASTQSLVDQPWFRIERRTAEAGYHVPLHMDGEAHVWIVLKGGGHIACRTGTGVLAADFRAGDVILLPAGLAEPQAYLRESSAWLDVTVPISVPLQPA